MIKGLLISVNEKPIEVSFGKRNISELKRLIGCDCLTCVTRKIGKKYYDFWIDDEGLFKESKDGSILASGLCMNAPEVIAGNILILNNDGEDIKSLDETDFVDIYSNLFVVKSETCFDYSTSIGDLKMKFMEGGVFVKYEI